MNSAPLLTSGSGNGQVTTEFGSAIAAARSAVLQTDGKIVVTGYSFIGTTTNSALVRYNADGSLDSAFGSDGIVLSGPNFATGSGVALQSDGKIVTTGGMVLNGTNGFALARYNSDGSLDTAFGTGGKVITNFGSAGAYGITIQTDGKIVLGGRAGNDFALARYNADGSLDSSFGSGGEVTTAFGASVTIYSLTNTPDGKIIVAGVGGSPSSEDFALARYNNDGSLDTTFGSGGKVTTDFASSPDIPYSVTVQSDGKTIVSGLTNSGSNENFALVRYNLDGSLDGSFGTGGKVTTDFGGTSGEAGESVKIQADGKIVVAGTTYHNPDGTFALARYNSDGSLDASFGSGGEVTTAFGFGFSSAYSLVIQADGKIVLTGGAHSDFALARYNIDGSLDASFGSGAALGGTTLFTEDGSPAVLNAMATIHDVELDAAGSYAGASLMLARHGGANAEDIFGASGVLAALDEGSNLVLSGVTVGTVTHNSGGTLLLTFAANATEATVNDVMRNITYADKADNPVASVQIDWSFSDGNTGAQGSGGALAAAGTTIVGITAANDRPVNTVPGGFSTPADMDHAIAGLSVHDPDSTSLTTVLHVDYGTLTIAAVGGATIHGSGTSTVSLDGTVAQIDAALATANNVVYHSIPGFSGTDVLSVTSYDHVADSNGSITGVTNSLLITVLDPGLFTSGDDTVILPGAGTYYALGGDDAVFMTASNETVYGGTGDDGYLVEATGNTIVELANEGNDTVVTSSLAAYMLGANVENLVHTGGNVFTGIGNALDNIIIGGTGNDYLVGLDGNDVLIDGNGLNTLQGGKGDDIYAVQSNADTVFEFANEGTDQVQTFLSFYQLSPNVENLLFVGSASHTGIGNGLNNVLIGGTGNDYLIGLDGNDTLIDGSGLNTLQGGTGNDIYAVQSNTDTVFEFANEGTDEVQTFLASYTLSPNVEQLTFVGAFSHNGTGNELANTFTGSSATDTFTGAGGNDVFNYRSHGNGLDIITDFNADNANAAEHDHIDLHGRGLNFASLAITAGSDGVVIGIPGGDAIYLKNVNALSLDAGDFFF